MLTISRLSRWSINYYNDTARQATLAAMDRQRANGGLGEYYTERDTRTPTWLIAGDTARTGQLVAGVLASLAELELELGRERRSAAREARRAGGQSVGRPKAISDEKVALAQRDAPEWRVCEHPRQHARG